MITRLPAAPEKSIFHFRVSTTPRSKSSQNISPADSHRGSPRNASGMYVMASGSRASVFLPPVFVAMSAEAPEPLTPAPPVIGGFLSVPVTWSAGVAAQPANHRRIEATPADWRHSNPALMSTHVETNQYVTD